MLEKETEQIIGVMRQRTIGSAQSIALREILAADIPQPVRAFFRCDVEHMLHDEEQAALRGSRFNQDHPDVRSARAQLRSALVLHFTFRRAEFLNRLNDSVHLLANFLVRPQWTLGGVVFEREDSISTGALGRLMEYFSPYDYLRTVLIRYAGDKGIAAFNRGEFSALMFRIDGAFIRRRTGAELTEAMKPMYEFFDYPRNTGKSSMPVRALIRFFEDKGMTDVHTRLEGELAQGKSEMGLSALEEVLEDVRRSTGEFKTERTDRGAAEGLPPVPESGGIPGSGTGSAPDTPPGPPDRVPPAAPGRRTIELGAAIADGEKRKFIRKIFRQDDEKYNAAIAHLEKLPAWKEASKYIDEIFIAHDVDPYSGEAERFTEIVFKQYHPSR